MASSIKLVFNHYDRAAHRLREETAALVRDTAEHIKRRAEDNAVVDTGAMRASGYVVTSDSSDYAKAAAAVAAASPKAVMLSEEPPPLGRTLAVIVFGVRHALFVESGTVHMGAQPFLAPAAEAERPDWELALTAMWERIR